MSTMVEEKIRGPKELHHHVRAIKNVEDEYRKELKQLQADCSHSNVLRHEDSNYRAYRVCEDCGLSCEAQWDSSVHVKKGDPVLMGKRYYEVSWQEYHRALPVVK